MIAIKSTEDTTIMLAIVIRPKPVLPSIKMREPLRAECEHFIESIETGKRPRSDGYDGLRVVKVLEAAQKSLKSGGKPVKIEEG